MRQLVTGARNCLAAHAHQPHSQIQPHEACQLAPAQVGARHAAPLPTNRSSPSRQPRASSPPSRIQLPVNLPYRSPPPNILIPPTPAEPPDPPEPHNGTFPPPDHRACQGTPKLTQSQTSIGTGYDLANAIFSPDGRNFQVEYAIKAVENGGTSLGIRCKDGVVLAVEKVVGSKLLKPNANKRIATVDRHVGVVRSPACPRIPTNGPRLP